MVNPGVFAPRQKAWLLGEKDAYRNGVKSSMGKDVMRDITRRFFLYFPVAKPWDYQPTDEEMVLVDPDKPSPEYEVPGITESETVESYSERMNAFNEYSKTLIFRVGQVQRRIRYQYNSDRMEILFKKSEFVSTLMLKLAGIKTQGPRKRRLVDVWSENNPEVGERVNTEIARDGIPGKLRAAERQRRMKSEFSKVPVSEKERWELEVERLHDIDKADHKKALRGPPPTDRESRQQCIERLAAFMQPIMNELCAHTGWKCTFIAGGPEPADNGGLNVITLHSGTTGGDVPVNWAQSEKTIFDMFVYPSFGRFLQRCYTPEECAARAIPDGASNLMQALNDGSAGSLHGVTTQEIDTLRKIMGAMSPASRETSSSHSTPPPLAPSGVGLSSDRPSTPDRDLRREDAGASAFYSSVPPTPVRSRTASLPPSSRSQHAHTGNTPIPYPPILTDETDNMQCDFPGSVSAESPAASPPPQSPAALHFPQSRAVSPISDFTTASEPVPSRGQKRAIAGESVTPATQKRQRKNQTGDESEAETSAINNTTAEFNPSCNANKRKPKTKKIGEVAATPASSVGVKRTSQEALEKLLAFVLPVGVVSKEKEYGWMIQGLAMMKKCAEGGDLWTECVGIWFCLEQRRDFRKSSMALSAVGRPKGVGDWVARARKAEYRPAKRTPSTHESTFWKWWISIQPHWRRDNDDTSMDDNSNDSNDDKTAVLLPASPPDNESWDEIARYGSNGILLVLAALYFWARDIEDLPKDGYRHKKAREMAFQRWELALADVITVLKGLQG